MKTKITMIVLLLIGSYSFAQVGTIFASGGLNYEITSGTTVKVGENPDVIGAITIPSSVKYNGYTYQVTSIGSDAFYDDPYNNVSSNRSNLTSVSIPNSVISIGDRAFYYCWNLTSVNIPTSVTNIGDFAFSSCGLLTSIVIPNSVVSIGSHAFYSSGLVSVSISNSLQFIPQGAFSFCRSLTSVSIPNSVIGVGAFAFGDCVSLTAVILPNTLSTIKRNCFENCVNLTSINIPSSISTIEERAFQNCTSLTSVTVDWPNPLPIIRNVFAGINLSNVILNVPGATAALYDATPVWTEFAPIIQALPLYTSIPDANFEQALFDQGIDAVNGDHQVLTSAIVNLTALDVSNKSIADLTGIASFTALTDLNCEGNRLSSLNIATLVLLEKLNCSKNQLTTIDFRNQSMLRELRCQYNMLTTINIAGISNLQQVYCSNNLLTSLDFSTQTNLRQLYCNNNQLTTIDIKNQEPSLNNFNCQNNLLNNIDLRGFYVLADFNCTLNPNLNCITVDDVAFANANFLKDTSANFSTNCYAPLVLNYCVGTPAVGLASPYAANVATRWYTVAVGGRFSTTAPTPSTNTVGTRIFYVSQVLGGIESARIAITVNTLAVPAAPASITGIAAPSIFVGTTTTVAYAVAPVANTTSYNWTVPAGINIVSGQGTTTLSVNFNNVAAGAGSIGNLMVVEVNAQGCSTKVARTLALTKALPTAPIAIRMTDAALAVPASGIATAVTNISRYIGQPTVLTLTATPVEGVSNYEWELPAGVNVLSGAVATRGGAFGSNVITVNFAGISASGMFRYTTTSGILTYVLRVGVKAVSGVGASTTSNASLINPGTTSTTRLLTLTAVAPKAPAAIRMTDAMPVDPTKAITVMSTFIGTPKALTLTATPVATANEYNWELPAGAKQLSGGNSNVITVNFADVATGTTSLYLGVKAVNGAGVSVTSNASLVPATNSTARLLRLSATIPGTVPAVTGQLVGLCGKNAYTYTISPSALATSYEITAPVGSKVTSKDKATNGSNVIKTSDLEFTVVYPEKFAATKETPAAISVFAVNGVGKSAMARTLGVTTTVPAPTDITITATITKFERRVKIHKRSSNKIIGTASFVVIVNDGAQILSGQGTDEVEIDYSNVPPTIKSTKVFMYDKNSCGVLSLPVIRTIILEPIAAKTAETLTIEATEIYPNPVVDDLSIDVIASKAGNLDIAIYSLEGIQVANSKTFELKEGANTITQNVSNLAKGIYIVQLLNSSNKEVITKKLIKN